MWIKSLEQNYFFKYNVFTFTSMQKCSGISVEFVQEYPEMQNFQVVSIKNSPTFYWISLKNLGNVSEN